MPSVNSKSFQNCFTVSIDQKDLNPPRGGKRQIVKGLSKQARRKLITLINSLGHTGEAFFVTLTMREASEDFNQWKTWLNRTLTSLRKAFPQLSGIWRLEFQKRGIPHFHFLLYTNTHLDLRTLQEKIQTYWSNAVGKQNTGSMGTILKSNTVQRVKDIRKCGFYLSIYQAKNEQDRKDIPTGRTWGIINKKGLPIAKYNEISGQSLFFMQSLKRIYRRYCLSKGAYPKSPLIYSLKTRGQGFTGFMPRSLQRKLFSLCKDLQSSDYYRYCNFYHGSDYWNGNAYKLYERSQKIKKVA